VGVVRHPAVSFEVFRPGNPYRRELRHLRDDPLSL
jgi:hypothetical protein